MMNKIVRVNMTTGAITILPVMARPTPHPNAKKRDDTIAVIRVIVMFPASGKEMESLPPPLLRQ